jgi:hypothetical protein
MVGGRGGGGKWLAGQCNGQNCWSAYRRDNCCVIWYPVAVEQLNVLHSARGDSGGAFALFLVASWRSNRSTSYECNTEAIMSNLCRRGKAISITYSKCVSVALGTQHAIRMRHIAICPLPPLYNLFPHYLRNDTIFEKKLLKIKCVFWFSLQLLSETFLILRRTGRDMIKNLYRSSCEVPVVVVIL